MLSNLLLRADQGNTAQVKCVKLVDEHFDKPNLEAGSSEDHDKSSQRLFFVQPSYFRVAFPREFQCIAVLAPCNCNGRHTNGFKCDAEPGEIGSAENGLLFRLSEFLRGDGSDPRVAARQ